MKTNNLIKLLTTISLLIIYLILNTTTSQAAINIGNFKLSRYDYTNNKLDTDKMQSVCEEVYNNMRQDILKDIPLNIIYSTNTIQKKNGRKIVGNMIKSTHGTYNIVIATDKSDVIILDTLLHEIGHIIQYEHNISLEFFCQMMGLNYNPTKKTWENSPQEHFAEFFKYHYFNTHYEYLMYTNKIKIDTLTLYNYDFPTFLWLYGLETTENLYW